MHQPSRSLSFQAGKETPVKYTSMNPNRSYSNQIKLEDVPTMTPTKPASQDTEQFNSLPTAAESTPGTNATKMKNLLSETFNNQQTPKAKIHQKKPNPKMTSTSLLMQRFGHYRPHDGQSEQSHNQSQSSLQQTMTERKDTSRTQTQPDQIHHLKKAISQSTKEQAPKGEISKEQTETIDRLLSYTKRKEEKLKQLQNDKVAKEKQIMSQKVAVSAHSNKLAKKVFEKQLKTIPQEDPLLHELSHKEKGVQVDCKDLPPFSESLKPFKTIRRPLPNPMEKRKQKGEKKSEKQAEQGLKGEMISQEVQTDMELLNKAEEYQAEDVDPTNPEDSMVEDPTQLGNESQVDQSEKQESIIEKPNSAAKPSHQSAKQAQKQPEPNIKQQPKPSAKPSNNDYYLPIHMRYKLEQKKKQEWVEQQKQEAQEKEESTIQAIIANRKHASQGGETEFNDFIQNQERWLGRKNDFLLKERMKKNEVGVDLLTFKPTINQKSIKLAKKVHQNRPPEQRLQEYDDMKKYKREIQKEIQIPVFHPTISQKSKMMHSEYRQKDHFLSSRMQQVEHEQSFQANDPNAYEEHENQDQ